MQISLNFKNIDSSDSLKSHVQEKFDRLDKMLDNSANAHVVLSVEKLCNIVEINLNCNKMKIYAKEESDKNMYAAIDILSDKVKLQIKKNREKQRRHLSGDKQSIRKNAMDLEPLESIDE